MKKITIRQIRQQTLDQVWSQTLDQVDEQVNNQVRIQVLNQVWDRVFLLKNGVWLRVDDQIEKEINLKKKSNEDN